MSEPTLRSLGCVLCLAAIWACIALDASPWAFVATLFSYSLFSLALWRWGRG